MSEKYYNRYKGMLFSLRKRKWSFCTNDIKDFLEEEV